MQDILLEYTVKCMQPSISKSTWRIFWPHLVFLFSFKNYILFEKWLLWFSHTLRCYQAWQTLCLLLSSLWFLLFPAGFVSHGPWVLLNNRRSGICIPAFLVAVVRAVLEAGLTSVLRVSTLWFQFHCFPFFLSSLLASFYLFIFVASPCFIP